MVDALHAQLKVPTGAAGCWGHFQGDHGAQPSSAAPARRALLLLRQKYKSTSHRREEFRQHFSREAMECVVKKDRSNAWIQSKPWAIMVPGFGWDHLVCWKRQLTSPCTAAEETSPLWSALKWRILGQWQMLSWNHTWKPRSLCHTRREANLDWTATSYKTV